MKRFLSLTMAVVLAAVVAGVAGCGPSTATVSGEVVYDGKPVEDGYITFIPADGLGKDGGGPILAGRYRVDGLPPGPKVVKVIGTRKVNFASTSAEMQRRAEEARKGGRHDGLVDPADIVPDNAQGNNAEVELKAGEQTRDFALTPPAQSK